MKVKKHILFKRKIKSHLVLIIAIAVIALCISVFAVFAFISAYKSEIITISDWINLTSAMLSFAGTIILGAVASKQTLDINEKDQLQSHRIIATPLDGVVHFLPTDEKIRAKDIPQHNSHLVENGILSGFIVNVPFKIKTILPLPPSYYRIRKVIIYTYKHPSRRAEFMPNSLIFRFCYLVEDNIYQISNDFFMSEELFLDLTKNIPSIWKRYERGLVSEDFYRNKCKLDIHIELELNNHDVVTPIMSMIELLYIGNDNWSLHHQSSAYADPYIM